MEPQPHRLKYDPQDKHAHIRYLLLRRCEIELDKGNYADARLLAQDFLDLYSDHSDEIQKLTQLFIGVGNNLFGEKNHTKIRSFIATLVERAPFTTDCFDKSVITELSINLEEHYGSLSFSQFINGQFNSALASCGFVLLLNMHNSRARLLNYMIHRSIFMEHQRKTGNYGLSESFYFLFENSLIFLTLLYDLKRNGRMLFLNKLVGRCDLTSAKYYLKGVRTHDDRPLIKVGFLIKEDDVSTVLTHSDEGHLFDIFYVAGTAKPQIRLEDFLGNDMTHLMIAKGVSAEEYKLMAAA